MILGRKEKRVAEKDKRSSSFDRHGCKEEP